MTVVGIQKLNAKLDQLSKADMEQAIGKACVLVEGRAKENAPAHYGDLRNSIASEWNEEEGRVGTNLYYAPYVHQGTGIYAVNGDGRDTPWVWYDNSGHYTGTGEAGFVYTHGQQPQPFLADAFNASQEEIMQIFANVIKEATEK